MQSLKCAWRRLSPPCSSARLAATLPWPGCQPTQPSAAPSTATTARSTDAPAGNHVREPKDEESSRAEGEPSEKPAETPAKKSRPKTSRLKKPRREEDKPAEAKPSAKRSEPADCRRRRDGEGSLRCRRGRSPARANSGTTRIPRSSRASGTSGAARRSATTRRSATNYRPSGPPAISTARPVRGRPAKAKNIKWVATLGSQTYGNTGRRRRQGLRRHEQQQRLPEALSGDDVDLGVLVCFNEADGKFLWQHSSEKLPTGRVHDWPLQGICCSPLVEGDRLWFVTSRGEVRCLDVEGFYDGEDDGRPEKEEPARLFDVRRADDPAQDKVTGYVTELDSGKIPADLRQRFAAAGMPLPEGDIAVKADDKAKAPGKAMDVQGEGERRAIATSASRWRGPQLSAFKLDHARRQGRGRRDLGLRHDEASSARRSTTCAVAR